MSQNGEIETNLPLTEVSYFILLSLASGAQHGYAIMKRVEVLSKRRVTLSTGTLYGALKRMLELGWIDRLEDAAAQSGRVRKEYILTEPGKSLLRAEIERLEALVAAAHTGPAVELP